MTAQTTRAALCLGIWSTLDLIESGDMRAVASLPELEDGDNEVEGVI